MVVQYPCRSGLPSGVRGSFHVEFAVGARDAVVDPDRAVCPVNGASAATSSPVTIANAVARTRDCAKNRSFIWDSFVLVTASLRATTARSVERRQKSRSNRYQRRRYTLSEVAIPDPPGCVPDMIRHLHTR